MWRCRCRCQHCRLQPVGHNATRQHAVPAQVEAKINAAAGDGVLDEECQSRLKANPALCDDMLGRQACPDACPGPKGNGTVNGTEGHAEGGEPKLATSSKQVASSKTAGGTVADTVSQVEEAKKALLKVKAGAAADIASKAGDLAAANKNSLDQVNKDREDKAKAAQIQQHLVRVKSELKDALIKHANEKFTELEAGLMTRVEKQVSDELSKLADEGTKGADGDSSLASAEAKSKQQTEQEAAAAAAAKQKLDASAAEAKKAKDQADKAKADVEDLTRTADDANRAKVETAKAEEKTAAEEAASAQPPPPPPTPAV